MHDRWTSFTVVSLNLILPDAPSLGHNPVPSLPGPKMLHLQLKMSFAITLNGPTLRWRFQQPRCVQGPATLAQTSNESIETTCNALICAQFGYAWSVLMQDSGRDSFTEDTLLSAWDQLRY